MVNAQEWLDENGLDNNLTIEERISKLTDKLAPQQASYDRNGILYSSRAIIKPSRNESNYLDCLARLLKGTETCVAVFFDGEKLLIASNKKRPKHAEYYIEKLSTFINDPFNGIAYNLLIESAIKQIIFYCIKNNSFEIEDLKAKYLKESNVSSSFKTFLKVMEEYSKLGESKISGEIKVIPDLFKKVFEEIKEQQESNVDEAKLMWFCLSPLYDTNSFVNAVFNGKVDLKIVKAIKEKRVEYIDEKENVHAEMKIINKLYKNNKLNGKGGHIGISKLTCAPCWITIDLLNNALFVQPITVCGTHGGIYPNWIVPNIYYACKTNLLRRFEELASEDVTYKKSREGTRSKIPQSLPKITYEDLQKTIQKIKVIEEIEGEKAELELEELGKIKLKSKNKRRIKLPKQEKEFKTELARERKTLKQKDKERVNERKEKYQAQIKVFPKQN